MGQKKVLRVAILGCGKMGIHHLKIIKSLSYVELAGIADPRVNESEIRKTAGEGVVTSTTASELLDKVKPDVAHIITPPESHYELGKLVLERGIHAFIEKPFVLRAHEARELIDIARARGLTIFAGHQLLAQKATTKAEKLVPNIGDIIHLESYFSFRQVRKSISAVDQAIDILPHPVCTMLHFLKNEHEPEKEFNIKSIMAESDGEVRAIVERNGKKAFLIVSLKARPVESYLKIVGTFGTVHIDYVRGVVVNLSGSGADAVAAITNPYRQAWQTSWKTTTNLALMAFKKNRSYEGLSELIENFYQCVLEGKSPLVSPESIVDTVSLCESLVDELRQKEKQTEERARIVLEEKTKALPESTSQERVLVTGGNGFLGKEVCRQLSFAGWPVTSVSRHLPSYQARVPGVEYRKADLSQGLDQEILRGVQAVIHCASATSGGFEEHEKNSCQATEKIMRASAEAGIKKFIHISSLAVIKPGRNSRAQLDENSPVDLDNMGRGPYVWGKARSEVMAVNLGKQLGIDLKIIRPGPLVDFEHFEAPGRLGREVGSFFIVMGSKKSPLSVCNVQTIARVVRAYLKNYQSAPPLLNLVEPDSVKRKDLVARLTRKRKDLRPLYVPTIMVNGLSLVLKGLQKVVSPSKKPIDIAAAFASESYNTTLARKIISKASSE